MTLVLAERPRGAGWYDGGNRPFFPSRPLRTTQRRLAIAIALTAVAALGLTALALRDGIARQVHLLRLRDDPSLFEGMLSSGSAPREAACRDFVNEPAGKEALFRLYLVEYGRASTLKDEPMAPKGKPVFIAEMLTAPFDRAAITLSEEGHSCLTWTQGGHASYSMTNLRSDRRRLRAVLDLVKKLAGETFRLPEVAGLEFRVLRASTLRTETASSSSPARALEESGWGEDALRAVTSSVHPAVDLVCLFRKT